MNQRDTTGRKMETTIIAPQKTSNAVSRKVGVTLAGEKNADQPNTANIISPISRSASRDNFFQLNCREVFVWALWVAIICQAFTRVAINADMPRSIGPMSLVQEWLSIISDWVSLLGGAYALWFSIHYFSSAIRRVKP